MTTTNPKDVVGSKKARWFSYIPTQVLVKVGLALYEGARKYGSHNYRVANVRASVYLDACISGHLTPWWEGEDIDPDSGLNHLDKAIASLMVLRDSMLMEKWVDDRPPRVKNKNFLTEAHEEARIIAEKYPNPVPPYTEKGQ